MSNAIGSSHESNPTRRICNLRAVPLSHVADDNEQKKISKAYLKSTSSECSYELLETSCFVHRFQYYHRQRLFSMLQHVPEWWNINWKDFCAFMNIESIFEPGSNFFCKVIITQLVNQPVHRNQIGKFLFRTNHPVQSKLLQHFFFRIIEQWLKSFGW